MRIIYLFISLLISSISFSQNEANIWYFGDKAGLDFNSGSPVALTDGQMITQEGCASIADSNGVLQFYTDGISAWNRNHDIMLNGSGLNGNSSSTQSAIIVPKPNSSSNYYIFTVDAQGGENGLQYSEVDMTLDSGLGAVTTNKNILLVTPVLEKLTAVKHANGIDIWVIIHKSYSAEFYAYLVTDAGVQSPAVITDIGYSYSGILYTQSAGCMKVSPDGNRLAMAISKFGNSLQLFDFDNSTGVLSNQIDMVNGPLLSYGVEFSPSGDILYATGEDGLKQYDITLPTAALIESSATILHNGVIGSYWGSMQLATNGKIYITRLEGNGSVEINALSVINNPNELGIGSDFEFDTISLGSGLTRLGLPTFISSYMQVSFQTENVCVGDENQFNSIIPQTYDSLVWDFGDSNTSTEENPLHTYANAGDYDVLLTVTRDSQVFNVNKTITVHEIPIVTPIVELRQCDDDQDGFSVFNLNEANAEISVNYQNEIITYHDSELEAENGNNPIANATHYDNETVNSDTIWARVENENGCYDISQLNLLVSTTQIPNTFIREFYQCDDGENTTDGVSTFNFSSVSTEIQSLFPSGQQLTISYYKNLSEALSETNAINDITNYKNIGYSNTQDIYIRVDSALDNDCLGLGHHITLYVDALPVANSISNDIMCDDESNDGEYIFSLDNYNSQILNAQSSNIFEIQYFDSEYNAQNNIDPLSNFYLVDSTSQTLYARIQNRNNHDCFDITTFELGVSYLPTAYMPEDIIVCDDESNDGLESFDLTSQNESILNGQSSINNTISYYLSFQEAEEGINPLSTNFTNTTNPQTLYARIENINSPECYSITNFNLIVKEQPVLLMDELWYVCEGSSVEIIADEGYDYYIWSTEQTTRAITVDEPGQYSVTASNVYGNLICSTQKTITVSKSDMAVITDIETVDWSQNENSISVFIEGNGDYEYSLDGVNYQNGSVFTGLIIDEYTVYIRDKNGCGTINEDVYLIYYPRFFTPNGDNKNEDWQIINSIKEPNNKVFIYNRYGKLITQLNSNDKGWDGTLNGSKLPSSDYWFVLERQNGKTYTGHFSLKR